MSQVSDSTTFLRNNVEHTILKFTREYARHALLGIATPQSNPVVEAEFSVLRPDGVGAIITRLTGTAEDPQHRFHQFLENLGSLLGGCQELLAAFLNESFRFRAGWDLETLKTHLFSV